MTTVQREHAAAILRAILDTPIRERFDVVAVALRVAIDNGILDRDVEIVTTTLIQERAR